MIRFLLVPVNLPIVLILATCSGLRIALNYPIDYFKDFNSRKGKSYLPFWKWSGWTEWAKSVFWKKA